MSRMITYFEQVKLEELKRLKKAKAKLEGTKKIYLNLRRVA